MYATLAFDVESADGGTVQVFYSGEGQSFTEEHSQKAEVPAGKKKHLSFIFPQSASLQLRIDPTNGASQLSNMRLTSSAAVMCDFSYMPYDIGHLYSLGSIPFLWSAYDNEGAQFNSSVFGVLERNLKDVYVFNPAQVDKSMGNYVLIEIEAEGIDESELHSAKLSLVDLSDSTVCSFTFDLFEGKNSYLIRVSADSYWYTDIATGFKIDFDTEASASVVKMEILEGD